jgi:hypothetical protein
VGGEPLVDGVETILHNHRFIDAARELFGSSTSRPTFIVANLNAPMPAGPIADLRKLKVDFRVPGDPPSDKTWIATLNSAYGTVPDAADPKERNEDYCNNGSP